MVFLTLSDKFADLVADSAHAGRGDPPSAAVTSLGAKDCLRIEPSA